MYRLNYEYCMVLFRDPTGRKLLAGALVMQFIGALVIRKINYHQSLRLPADVAPNHHPVVTFVGIGAIAWLLMDLFSSQTGRAENRWICSAIHAKVAIALAMKKVGSHCTRTDESFTHAGRSPDTQDRSRDEQLKKDLVEAGFRSEAAPVVFTAVRSICALIFLFGGGGLALFVKGINYNGMVYTLVIAGIGLFGPTLVLKYLGNRRKQQIFLGLPDALDLMVVCVEAGLGLDQAMRKVSEEMKKSYRVIAEEFGMCNFHLQMGRARNQVLQELGGRTGVDDLRALASILIQADKFGSSIATALRVQSDSMRVRRQQIAEEKAAKTAVKLIFPLVLFIFPGIFVVLVGPAGIQMARDMFPAMGN